MSHLENSLKVTVLSQSAKFSLPDTPKVTRSTISIPTSYDEHPRQVKYGRPPPEILPMHPTSINSGGSLLRMRLLNSLRAKNISCTNSHILYRVGGGGGN